MALLYILRYDSVSSLIKIHNKTHKGFYCDYIGSINLFREFNIFGSWQKWPQILPILVYPLFPMQFSSSSHAEVESISPPLALVSETVATTIQSKFEKGLRFGTGFLGNLSPPP